MDTPVFIKMTERGPSFPSEYFVPKNKSAYYITAVSGQKYLTQKQMIMLYKAGLEMLIEEDQNANQ